jgi:hypothetical protein
MVAPIVKRAKSGSSKRGYCVVRLGHVEAPGSHGSGSDVALGPSSPCQPHLLFHARHCNPPLHVDIRMIGHESYGTLFPSNSMSYNTRSLKLSKWN